MIPEPRIAALQIAEIMSDPQRFQSRTEYPRDVLDDDLLDVEVFNPLFADLLSVWRDPQSEEVYVIDGHRRLELARRTKTKVANVQFIDVATDAEAFARGVVLNIAKWVFDNPDKVVWAAASRRAAVERALHAGWLDLRTQAAKQLFRFYPDLERRYASG